MFLGCFKKSTRTLRFRESLKEEYFATCHIYPKDTSRMHRTGVYRLMEVDGCEEIIEQVLIKEFD